MKDKRLTLILDESCNLYLKGEITLDEAIDRIDKFIYDEAKRLNKKRELSFKREEEVEE